MKIVCDACSAKYSIADEKVAGKVFKIRCKKCSNVIVVRGAQDAEATGAPELEQKETRVFDYSGYDNPQEAVAAAESSIADGAVWHVVIDQEQIGPMTPDEVRQRFHAGEIDVESFIWREGFADWERVDALADFADLAGANGANVDDAAAAMFGGPALDDGGVASDPADLFTAQAATADAGGLFGGGADDGGLFAGGGGAAAEPMAAEPMAAAAVDERMTGQRNENSVLFSLNNLASLASDSPKSSPTPMAASGGGGVGGGGGGMAQAGGQEGSGLIDIRAMASMYVGTNDGPAASGGGGIDDLPVFSQPVIASASPVLMPVAAPANSNKLLVALIAGIGALLLVAVLLVVLVLKGGGDDDKPTTAANDSDEDTSGKAVTGDGDGDGSGSAEKPIDPKADGTKTVPTGDDAAAKKAAADEAAAAKAEAKAEAKAKAEAARLAKAERLKNETPRERRARLKAEKKEREEAKKRRDEARRKREEARLAAAAKKPPSSSGGKCDELTCLVEPNKACCKKRGGGNNSKTKPVDSSLPERPSKGQIRSGMGRASGSVKGCGRKSNFSGKVSVKIRVSSSGRVSSASASGGKGSVNSCVASAVKRSAKFPKTQKGISFSYSYRL